MVGGHGPVIFDRRAIFTQPPWKAARLIRDCVRTESAGVMTKTTRTALPARSAGTIPKPV